ncbi:hypothetical protein PybrP1_005953, partial [[Pythium] brassicae (nom. inval.)]
MRSAGSVARNHYAHSRDRLPNRAYRRNAPQVSERVCVIPLVLAVRVSYRCSLSLTSVNAIEDTIVEDFNLEIDWNNSRALYRERVAMRRYTEETRVVIVWREISDTLRIADEPTDGVRFLKRGYIVIREAGADDGGGGRAPASPPRIVVQTCCLTAPTSNGLLADASSSKIGVITDFIIGTISTNISSSFEIIENCSWSRRSRRSGKERMRVVIRV